jgi:hypothetical protein
MKKGYSSVPLGNHNELNNKELYLYDDTSPLVADRATWWSLQKDKMSRKSFMIRSRTRGMKFLGGLLFLSLLVYYYFSSNTVHTGKSQIQV